MQTRTRTKDTHLHGGKTTWGPGEGAHLQAKVPSEETNPEDALIWGFQRS